MYKPVSYISLVADVVATLITNSNAFLLKGGLKEAGELKVFTTQNLSPGKGEYGS